MEVVRGEMVEKELDAMIVRRSAGRERDPDEREELWKVSMVAYNARRDAEMREAWCEREYHRGPAARHRPVLEALIARHEGEAAKLMEARPKGAA
jgi:hypothetical protein